MTTSTDVILVVLRDRFYIQGKSSEGKAWIRNYIASSTDSISIEFLPDYEVLLRGKGLTWEVSRCAGD